MLKELIKNRLTEALSLRCMKPIELSEITKIPKSSISQYMSGYSKPNSERTVLIARALNVNEAWLLGFDIPMERVSSADNIGIKSLEKKPNEVNLDENIIIYHRNGKTVKKKMSKEKMALLSSMLDALPDDDGE